MFECSNRIRVSLKHIILESDWRKRIIAHWKDTPSFIYDCGFLPGNFRSQNASFVIFHRTRTFLLYGEQRVRSRFPFTSGRFPTGTGSSPTDTKPTKPSVNKAFMRPDAVDVFSLKFQIVLRIWPEVGDGSRIRGSAAALLIHGVAPWLAAFLRFRIVFSFFSFLKHRSRFSTVN